MTKSATYYPDLHLVYLRLSGTIELVSLAARMAEWMYAFQVPKGYVCLTDLRGLDVVVGGAKGVAELVQMQRRVYEDIPAPDRSALLADSPVGIVAARLFEQQAQGKLEETVRGFRDEAAALHFLGFCAAGIDALLAPQRAWSRLT